MKIYIGTSGWTYYHWRKIFYPSNLKSENFLNFYAQHFNTVEINSSFYHLPRAKTFKNWHKKTPSNFLFSVKVWRRITHLKKLKNVKSDFKLFFNRAESLKEKFGPLLFQFPANFRATKENIKRLVLFLKFVRNREKIKAHLSFEFRHLSWFNNQIYNLLRRYNIALCWADTPKYPYEEEITADYLYLRLHGHEVLYASKYSRKQIKSYAEKIERLPKKIKNVYVYFDNDFHGYALKNARELIKAIHK